MEIITTGIYFENTYILNNGKDAIVIDPGDGLLDKINIFNKYNIKAILLTHGHIDHIDGIKHFLNVPIYLYKDELEVFNNTYNNLYDMTGINMPFDVNKLNIKLLNDNELINILGFNIKCIHTPGHTKGSCIYIINDKLAFTGDTLFNGSIGRTDFPTGSREDYKKSIELLKGLDDNITIYPGHGTDSNMAFEKKYNPFLK